MSIEIQILVVVFGCISCIMSDVDSGSLAVSSRSRIAVRACLGCAFVRAAKRSRSAPSRSALERTTAEASPATSMSSHTSSRKSRAKIRESTLEAMCAIASVAAARDPASVASAASLATTGAGLEGAREASAATALWRTSGRGSVSITPPPRASMGASSAPSSDGASARRSNAARRATANEWLSARRATSDVTRRFSSVRISCDRRRRASDPTALVRTKPSVSASRGTRLKACGAACRPRFPSASAARSRMYGDSS
mmetsp:Transcript_28467/g.93000  ORF Transcript_28467/g.93000 Transcript_28467/m.93000 type:complete len:256 (+) Transcript_28467:36-803(+)